MRVFLFFIGFSTLLFADQEAKDIAKKYASSVVKILLYDPKLVKELHLDEEEAYLTRGSGFFATTDGIIFTNRHVIEWCVDGYMVADWIDEKKEVHAKDLLTYTEGLENDPKIKKVYYVGHAIPIIEIFSDPSHYHLYKAEVLVMAEKYDGAILKIEAENDETFISLPFANAYQVVMGEDIVILGYPAQYAESDFAMDLQDTVTMSFGRHSGWDYIFDEDGFIKTDALIHEGNSGGPAFDDSEKVIGIATAMGVKTQIGLIEPINDMYFVASSIPDLLPKLIKNGLPVPKKNKEIKTVSGKKKALPKI